MFVSELAKKKKSGRERGKSMSFNQQANKFTTEQFSTSEFSIIFSVFPRMSKGWKQKRVDSGKWDEQKIYMKTSPSHTSSNRAWPVTMWRTSIISHDSKPIGVATLNKCFAFSF